MTTAPVKRSFLRRWLMLVALLHLPAFYIIAAMTLPQKLPNAAGLIALAPYVAGAFLIVFLLSKRGRR